jgi:bleomycin hydrolase
MRNNFFAVYFLIFPAIVMAQQPHDTGTFIEYKAGYYQNYILKGIEDFENPHYAGDPRKYFSVDLNGKELPNKLEKYTTFWRQPPISQGNTGTCWSFGTASMLESEIWRITGKSVKLSEMYTVYWEYVERADDFVKTHGETYYAEGSESNAWVRLMNNHGIVPYTAYSGLLPGQKVYDHEKMVEEINTYLQSVKKKGDWNEPTILSTVKSILNAYMGEPPQEFEYDGVKYTPQSFLSDYCKLIPNDYFSFMSTMSQTYNQMGELVEADNWFHGKNYYNVSLDDFLLVIVNSIKAGYSLCICGDVSEPGFDRYTQCGIIPTFDIPSQYIDENARQMRFENSTTTDDHCMHLIGYTQVDGKYWFLLKDSSSGAFDGKYKGYRFVSEDYVKLKMMNLLVYKEGGRPVLDKIIK